MLKFSQSSGVLVVGPVQVTGYAGNGAGMNNPAMQDRQGIGPLPRGKYTVSGGPFDHPRCGPYCLRLEPDPTNEMFGRSGFLIHGDSKDCPGSASHGCIVVPKMARMLIVSQGLKFLEVTE